RSYAMTTIETEAATGIQRKRPPGRTVTPSRALTWRKTGSGHALYLRDRGNALATVEPDAQHAGMWRIRMPDGWASDIANLAWAQEGPSRPRLFGLNRKETATEAPPVAQTAAGVVEALEAAE